MEDDDGPMPMPAKASKRKTLEYESLYLDNLPSAKMYEKSYMHRDIVSHTIVTPVTQFIITASIDGHVKFWKKMEQGIEFVKHYKAHRQKINALVSSLDGLRLCSTSDDQHIKFYDVLSFDMVHMIKTTYIPTCCTWTYARTRAIPRIAVADQGSGAIRIYNAEGQVDPLHIIDTLHRTPVLVMAFNPQANCVISGDSKGVLEYWDPETYEGLVERTKETARMEVKFKFKLDTDLYEMAKVPTRPTSISCAPDGKNFAVTALDKNVRVFRFATGKLRRKYNETLEVFEDAKEDGSLQLEPMDFGRRMAVERELDAFEGAPASNVIFDESGNFILFPTLLGVKVLNIVTNKLVRVLGRVENTERFLSISMFQGVPKKNSQIQRLGGSKKPKLMSDNPAAKEEDVPDPTLICCAFKKHRVYCFSNREPSMDEAETEGRDVFNEKPTLEESGMASSTKKFVMGSRAVFHTTKGDIFVKLFGDQCPKTVENFCTHARNGYYDKTKFHRVIKNFMIQGGDPNGDGTGGESIWGGEFEDEFHRNLRHDRPFTLSSANCGPNTNGSQFFITTVPTPWLDNKHTVFGRVETGMDTVSAIEAMETDRLDRPYEDVEILNVDIL